MLICLIIALIATFIWINITIADIVNANKNANANDVNAKIRMALTLIMALFWAIIIRYYEV